MKLDASALRTETLASLGHDAAELVLSNDLALLHSRFGYALAFDRDAVRALHQDIEASLREVGASGFAQPDQFDVMVTYYRGAPPDPYGLIECLLPTDGTGSVLIELIVTIDSEEGYVNLEQFSGIK